MRADIDVWPALMSLHGVVGPGRRPPAPPADAGTAAAEFTMVAALLTVLAAAVLQLALALHVRNTVQDAAAEGARVAALLDSSPEDGVRRTRELIRAALGAGYAPDVRYSAQRYRAHPSATITVVAPLPLLALFGPEHGLEVHGHAALEQAPGVGG